MGQIYEQGAGWVNRYHKPSQLCLLWAYQCLIPTVLASILWVNFPCPVCQPSLWNYCESPHSKTWESIVAKQFCVNQIYLPSDKEGTLEDGRMEPRLNWIRKARWMNSGFPGSEELSREKNSVDKVSVLQQQILTLTEEVKSQKVSVVNRLLFLRVGP